MTVVMRSIVVQFQTERLTLVDISVSN